MNAQLDLSSSPISSDVTNNSIASLIAVQGAFAALRLNKPVLLRDGTQMSCVIALDGLSDDVFTSITQKARGWSFLVSKDRALMLGVEASCSVSMPLVDGDTPSHLITMASSKIENSPLRPCAPEEAGQGAIDLLTLSGLLPCGLFLRDVSEDSFIDAPILDSEHLAAFPAAKVESLKLKSVAPLPVRGDIDAHISVFQYATGGGETALMVGTPDPSKPLPIRIHSACVTGDIFGSEKCDCGPQLRLAIEKMEELGGGCVVYLHQEGRGIGLSNKIRAYGLQAEGVDTVDANNTLGFEDDLRRYDVAAKMLGILGWSDVRLMTNNPRKVAALDGLGIRVVERISHEIPPNTHNRSYLATKAKRSGHILSYSK